MSDKLRVGIVGCGLVAEGQHIPSFMRLKKNVVLQAVCDKNENLVREIAMKHSIPGVYCDLSQMLSKENLDIIDICTPPQTHAPLAVEAIEHGCHVLLEKPMALKTSDCDLMIDASCRYGVKLCVVHRVTRIGGKIKIMVYNRRSLIALYKYLHFNLLRGKPFRSISWILYHHQESIGTKALTIREIRNILSKYPVCVKDIRARVTNYDLLWNKPFLFRLGAYILAYLFGFDRVGWFITIELEKTNAVDDR